MMETEDEAPSVHVSLTTLKSKDNEKKEMKIESNSRRRLEKKMSSELQKAGLDTGGETGSRHVVKYLTYQFLFVESKINHC